MARRTTCPYCQRDVGLMADRPTPYSKPRPPRMVPHAAEDRPSSGRGVRPKCVKGQLYPEIDPSTIRETPRSPSRTREVATR